MVLAVSSNATDPLTGLWLLATCHAALCPALPCLPVAKMVSETADCFVDCLAEAFNPSGATASDLLGAGSRAAAGFAEAFNPGKPDDSGEASASPAGGLVESFGPAEGCMLESEFAVMLGLVGVDFASGGEDWLRAGWPVFVVEWWGPDAQRAVARMLSRGRLIRRIVTS